jgi:hypothetical protein
MNLDWRLKPHEWLATDALWTAATQKCREIWDDEVENDKQERKSARANAAAPRWPKAGR